MADLRVLLLLLALPALAQAVDLSGTWQGDDGGEYYLVQRDAKLYWYAERSATEPVWSNIFDGRLRGNEIRGDWTDVPKGRTRGHGRLQLEVREGGNLLVITDKTGGYGGNRLTRVGVAASPMPMQPAPMAQAKQPAPVAQAKQPMPMRPQMAEVKPMPMGTMVKEDCVAFDWNNAERKQANGRWKIADGNHWLFDFGDNQREASQALRVIKRYRLNQSCFVGRPNPSLSYLLSGDQAPSGALNGEDCIAFNPERISVEQHGGNWKIVDGSHWMFDFGANEAEANQALAIIKKHGFTQSCFVGRPDPSFTYLRK